MDFPTGRLDVRHHHLTLAHSRSEPVDLQHDSHSADAAALHQELPVTDAMAHIEHCIAVVCDIACCIRLGMIAAQALIDFHAAIGLDATAAQEGQGLFDDRRQAFINRGIIACDRVLSVEAVAAWRQAVTASTVAPVRASSGKNLVWDEARPPLNRRRRCNIAHWAAAWFEFRPFALAR